MDKFRIIKENGVIPKYNYPNINSVNDNVFENYDFYNFSNGVELDNKEIQKLINECLDDINNETDCQYVFRGTGRVMVLVFNSVEEVMVIVTDSYKEFTYFKNEH